MPLAGVSALTPARGVWGIPSDLLIMIYKKGWVCQCVEETLLISGENAAYSDRRALTTVIS